MIKIDLVLFKILHQFKRQKKTLCFSDCNAVLKFTNNNNNNIQKSGVH